MGKFMLRAALLLGVVVVLAAVAGTLAVAVLPGRILRRSTTGPRQSGS